MEYGTCIDLNWTWPTWITFILCPPGLAVTWLGTSSGRPSVERNVSCTVIQSQYASFLVDAGEGTHRQLQQADVDPAKIDGIFVTHLHGDHCFGLPTTLMMIDSAKAERWEVSAAAATSGTQPDGGPSSSAGKCPSRPTTYVYGPPGLGELLRVSLAMTRDLERLKTRFEVTELVVLPGDERDAVQLASGRHGVNSDLDLPDPAAGTRKGSPRSQSLNAGASGAADDNIRAPQWAAAVNGQRAHMIAEGGAMWDAGTCGPTSSSSSDVRPSGDSLLRVRRQASRAVFDDPELKVAKGTPTEQ